jgi:hypothetical protein
MAERERIWKQNQMQMIVLVFFIYNTGKNLKLVRMCVLAAECHCWRFHLAQLFFLKELST